VIAVGFSFFGGLLLFTEKAIVDNPCLSSVSHLSIFVAASNHALLVSHTQALLTCLCKHKVISKTGSM